MGSSSLSMILCIVALFLGGFAILLDVLTIYIEDWKILFVYVPIIVLAIALLTKIFSKD